MFSKVIILNIIVFMIAFPSSVYAESPISSVAKSERNTTERIRSKDGTWSIPVASNILSSDTAMHHARGSETNGGRTSGAFDISAPIGTFVYAPCDGDAAHTSKANEGGYGNNVQVRCNATGLVVWIGHLKDIMVTRGESVDEATIIGTVGRTGMTDFNHIHITLRGLNDKRIEDHFDMSQFHWSPFDNPSGNGFSWSGNAKRVSSAKMTVSGAMVFAPMVIMALLAYIMLSIMIHNLSKDYKPKQRRIVMVSSCHGVMNILIIISMITGFNQIVAAELSNNVDVASTAFDSPLPKLDGSDYSNALRFVEPWEGWKCTEDGHHTMGGISQGAYDAWRKSKGFPTQDVCKYLKKSERKMILRKNYWEASGADMLEWPLNVAVFDMAVGSGPNEAKRLLKSATTFQAYQDARRNFYSSMKVSWAPINDRTGYRKAWLNRVDDLDKFIKTGKLKGE